MAGPIGNYVTNNTPLVLVVLAVIGLAAFFFGEGTVAALAAMIFGGILMWQAGHHDQEPDGEDVA